MSEPTAYLSDAPAVRAGEVRDELSFSDFRPALVEVLTTTETPLTVGVFGPWGSAWVRLRRRLP